MAHINFGVTIRVQGDSPPSSGSEGKAVRKRNGGPRSKSGCITCRIRHVKCDEKRPACDRCTKTGRKCDGYQKSTWEIMDTASMASIVQMSSDPRAASDPHSGRGFSIFERLTENTFAGLFDSILWREILRASHYSDTIYHAATALGSAYEAYTTRSFDLQTVQEDRALKQYNKAIRSLTKANARGEQAAPDVTMAASILFMAFEMLRKEYGKAIQHARSGIGIFAEHHKQGETPSRETLISKFHLENLLRLLETHLCELSMEGRPLMPRISLVGRQAPRQSHSCFPEAPAADSPPAFANPSEAQLELDLHWHDLMFILHEMLEPENFATTMSIDEFVARSIVHKNAFDWWQIRFDKLIQDLHTRAEPLTRLEKKMLAQMEMYHLSGRQILETCLEPSEMRWDDFQTGFERVLQCCETIIENDEPQSATKNHGFQLGNHGIVPAVFHVLWKCRSARLRLRALQILSTPRQDGLWDGELVEKVGWYIDEVERGPGLLEEAAKRDASPAEIPIWKRVVGIDVRFSSSGRDAVLTLLVPQSETSVEIGAIKKIMSW